MIFNWHCRLRDSQCVRITPADPMGCGASVANLLGRKMLIEKVSAGMEANREKRFAKNKSRGTVNYPAQAKRLERGTRQLDRITQKRPSATPIPPPWILFFHARQNEQDTGLGEEALQLLSV
jgi:hypothetical protein